MQRIAATEYFPRILGTAWEETALFSVLSLLPPVSAKGPWLAGGALRRTIAAAPLESDFDFFFASQEQMTAFTAQLSGKALSKTKETEHHEQWEGYLSEIDRRVVVQCIKFQFYQLAEDVIGSFDFTICQFAYDGDSIYASDYAMWDLGRKRLAINKITFPVSSMRRLLKYARQGFTACDGCLASLATAIAENPALADNLHIKYVD